jgi:hypothetical protein
MNYAANTYPFRQDSVLYFFGLDQPGLVADRCRGRHGMALGDDPTVEEIV